MIGVILVAIAFASVVGLGIWWAIHSARKLREAMEALAHRHGWTLHRNDRALVARLPHVHPFTYGSNPIVDWGFSGQINGNQFLVVDFHSITQTHSKNGTQTHHHHARCCVLDMPLHGHDLSISKEHILRKLQDALGGEDIDFESDAFSRRYWVKCADRRFAYDVLHPDMIAFLMPMHAWTWHWTQGRLVVHQQGTLRPHHVEPLIGLAAGFRSRLPRHLLH